MRALHKHNLRFLFPFLFPSISPSHLVSVDRLALLRRWIGFPSPTLSFTDFTRWIWTSTTMLTQLLFDCSCDFAHARCVSLFSPSQQLAVSHETVDIHNPRQVPEPNDDFWIFFVLNVHLSASNCRWQVPELSVNFKKDLHSVCALFRAQSEKHLWQWNQSILIKPQRQVQIFHKTQYTRN